MNPNEEPEEAGRQPKRGKDTPGHVGRGVLMVRRFAGGEVRYEGKVFRGLGELIDLIEEAGEGAADRVHLYRDEAGRAVEVVLRFEYMSERRGR